MFFNILNRKKKKKEYKANFIFIITYNAICNANEINLYIINIL